MWRQLAYLTCTTLLAGSIVACGDLVTGPSPQPPSDVSPAAEEVIGTTTLGVPPLNNPSSGALSWAYTGITIPQYATAVITVTGSITVAPNPLHACCFGEPSPNYVGTWDAWGATPGPPWNQLRIQLGPGNGSQWTLRQMLGGARTDTIYFGAATQVWVARNGVDGGSSCVHNASPPVPPGCTCPDGPCYSYAAPAYSLSGTQTITVTRIDDKLRLTPSAINVQPGTVVTFTASEPLLNF